MSFFDINNIFFEIWGYPMSYLEFFGTVAGAIAVWLSAKANVWSWPIGIINVTLFFFLFFQVQLYPDMFLQLFFFITNLMGWWRWKHPKGGEEDHNLELKVSYMPLKQMILFSGLGSSARLYLEVLPAGFMKFYRPFSTGRALFPTLILL